MGKYELRKRLNSTHKKLLTTLRPGTVDSQVNLAQLSGVRFGVVALTLPLLIRTGYVKKIDAGYSLTTKGVAMADALLDIRENKRKSRSD